MCSRVSWVRLRTSGWAPARYSENTISRLCNAAFGLLHLEELAALGNQIVCPQRRCPVYMCRMRYVGLIVS